MSLARYGRSPLGAFIRTPLGAKGDGNTFAKQLTDHINLIESARRIEADYIASQGVCFSIRRDSPTLGTQIGGIFTNTTLGFAGKFTSVSDPNNYIRRSRVGITFPQLVPSYPVGTQVYLHIEFKNWSNTFGESPTIWIAASTTDDIGLYSNTSFIGSKTVWDWEENADDLIATIAYGTIGQQRLLIPNGVIQSHLGQRLSLVIVTEQEITETGILTWPGNTPPKFAGADIVQTFVDGLHGFFNAALEVVKP